MRNKLVIWGTNAENEKVLIALELQAEANKIVLYTFPEAIVTEDFSNKMMAEWRTGATLPFPEGYNTLERELSVTDSLLPDDLKVDRPDLIQRAQTEWHFSVLSAKLHKAYEQELEEFREKIRALTAYDNNLWDSLRGFWDKVQEQSRERNLYREHADSLRDNINGLFDDMKKMRTRVQDEFSTASQKVFEDFNTGLADIEKRIEAGGSKLNSVFEDLKQMQRRYRDARMSNEHRNKLWERLDGAFKAAKERKFGPSANEGSLVERQERRIEGLNEAMKRMEESIRRDEEELTFQRKKVAGTEGQLEAQIRSAKIKMVEERMISKKEKLQEMTRTRDEVGKQIVQVKDKEQKRRQFDAAKEAAKSEIAAGIKSKTTEMPPSEDKFSIGDLLMEAVEKAKAVGAVVSEIASDVIDEGMELAANAANVLSKDDSKQQETATAEAEAPAETTEAPAVAAIEPVEAPVVAAVETVEAPEVVTNAVEEAVEATAETVEATAQGDEKEAAETPKEA